MSHELAVRRALAAFEPMVPPHVMTALQQVIDGYLNDVTHFNVTTHKVKTCEICGYVWDDSIFGVDFKCIMCYPPKFLPNDMYGGEIFKVKAE